MSYPARIRLLFFRLVLGLQKIEEIVQRVPILNYLNKAQVDPPSAPYLTSCLFPLLLTSCISVVVLLQLITSIDTLLLAKVHHLTLGFLLFVLCSSVAFDKCKKCHVSSTCVCMCVYMHIWESTDLIFNLSYSQCSFSLTYIFTSVFLIPFCISDLLSGIASFFLKSEIHSLEFLKCGPVYDCLPFLSASKCLFLVLFLNGIFARFKILDWLFSFSTLFTVVHWLFFIPFLFLVSLPFCWR